MAFPTLDSELVCLQHLHQVLRTRLDLERVYTSSLAAWRTAAYETGPRPRHALHALFLSLVEAAENDMRSRRAMERTLQSQIDGVLVAMKDLQDHFGRIHTRSGQLEKFDQAARNALEQRKLQYFEWKVGKPRPASPTGVRLRARPRNPPVRTESEMGSAYGRADMEVRHYVSKAEVARCSFKDKAVEQVEAISLAYRVVIDAIAKCLRLFAEDQLGCAINMSVGAGKIVKGAGDISGFLVANTFQEALESEAQDISTASAPYQDLESTSRYPTIQSQPIILGFFLPPPRFSYTPSTRVVVDAFCQLVYFIHDHRAWELYATRSTTDYHTRAPTFRHLERCWSKDDNLNRDLLRSFGPSTCADLVKALLASFPTPLVNCSDDLAERLRPDPGEPLDTVWAGSSDQDDAIALVPLVEPLHNRPQGEMLRALCDSLIPVFKRHSQIPQEPISEIFSDLLTRKGECIKHAFPILVMEIRTVVTIIDNRNALPRPSQRIFDSPRAMSPAPLPAPFYPQSEVINSASSPPLPAPMPSPPPAPTSIPPPAPSPAPAAYCSPQSNAQAMSTAVQVEHRLDEGPSNYKTAGLRENALEVTINDMESLKRGIIKPSKDTPYIILLVGETGVGKSTFLRFLANVFIGNSIGHYDFEILDRGNEQNISSNQGQANSIYSCELTSSNGIVVRILDVSGLADTGGIEEDELHKKNIAAEIRKHVDSVTAVLVLAKGTVPRITVGTDAALSTLSAIFPKSLANCIAFVFTNVPNSLSWNFAFAQATIPDVLRDAPQFLLDNPIALQQRYLSLKSDPNKKKMRTGMRKAMQDGEQMALEMLVKLFDWLDRLEPQQTTEMVYLYDISQNIESIIMNTFAKMDQAATKKVEVDKLMGALKNDPSVSPDLLVLELHTHLMWNIYALPNFEKAVNPLVWPMTTHTLDEQMLNNQSIVERWEVAKDAKEKTAVLTEAREMVLRDLNQTIDRSTNDLARLVERYARLSLSGSFSTGLARVVMLLEQNYVVMERKGVSQDHLQEVKASFDSMKRKLELLNKAKDIA